MTIVISLLPWKQNEKSSASRCDASATASGRFDGTSADIRANVPVHRLFAANSHRRADDRTAAGGYYRTNQAGNHPGVHRAGHNSSGHSSAGVARRHSGADLFHTPSDRRPGCCRTASDEHGSDAAIAHRPNGPNRLVGCRLR